VKTPLSLGALALALAGTTISARAECVGRESLHCLVSTAIDPPKQSHDRADAAPLNHPVAKRAKPQQGDDEKAPALKPPPALPRQVTQK
jgi:hypothetical protein